jgi:hypothetical protein
MKKCNCKYYLLRQEGYNPLNHAFNCQLRENKKHHRIWKKLIKLPEGDNPYKEVNRFKND